VKFPQNQCTSSSVTLHTANEQTNIRHRLISSLVEAETNVMFVMQQSLCTRSCDVRWTAQQTTVTSDKHDGRRHSDWWGRFSFTRQRSLLHCITRKALQLRVSKSL